MALVGQTALISGAGSGLGRAIAIELAAAGAGVVLLGRTAEKLEAVKIQIAGAGGQAVVASCDVTDRSQVIVAVQTALTAVGAIDILVCNAGINVPKRSLRSLDPADWDRVLSTNLTGAFNLVHAVLPSMRDRGSGLVIQIASISGMRASTLSGAAYSVSKFGQAALGVCIGREERGRSIRSTVIYPGETDTGFLDARAARPGGGDNMRKQALLQPGDIAAAVRFVAELPPRAHVPELVIKPAVDDFS
jgi:NADP-dependent 3-hydroxy acid dehydrogenase YdfG